MKNIHLGRSELTNNIFIYRGKNGIASETKDVTSQAVISVAAHILDRGEPVFVQMSGTRYVIKVEIVEP